MHRNIQHYPLKPRWQSQIVIPLFIGAHWFSASNKRRWERLLLTGALPTDLQKHFEAGEIGGVFMLFYVFPFFFFFFLGIQLSDVGVLMRKELRGLHQMGPASRTGATAVQMSREVEKHEKKGKKFPRMRMGMPRGNSWRYLSLPA